MTVKVITDDTKIRIHCEHVFAGDDTDVDECKSGLGLCGSAEVAKTCTNSPGSYTCDCQNGYELVSGTCRGISHTCIMSFYCIVKCIYYARAYGAVAYYYVVHY